VISGPGTYVDFKHHFSLKAIEQTNCCFFDLKTFKDVVSKNSKLSDFLIHMISKKSISYYQKFISITQKQVNGRIAETLLYLRNYIYQTNPMELTVTFQDIAEMTGMSKDTAVRVIKDLCSEKIIEMKNNQLMILNPEKLNQISELG
jgi:CRP/FNR family transcriptional regulator